MELRNAIYGDIILSDDEVKIIDSFEMQRLKLIKQLGFVNFVYPCANHTRFEHSLGTRWLAQKIVRLSGLKLSAADEELLYLAALLHDIAEPCFVHVTERFEDKGMPPHEKIIEKILDGTYKDKVIELKGNELENVNFVCDVLKDKELDEIKDIFLNPETSKLYLKELIDGYIDADNLDYLNRDAFYTGLPYGNYDDRIFSTFRIVTDEEDGKNKIAFRDSPDTLNAILSILNSRFILRKAVYLHHTALIADQMFLTSLNLALSKKIINEYDIFICGDFELLYKMRELETSKILIDMLLQRRLFKRAYVLDYRTPTKKKESIEKLRKSGEYDETIQKLSTESQIDKNNILLGVPAPIGWKDYDLIPVVQDNNSLSLLGDKIPVELHTLEEQYRSLWKFSVYFNVHSTKKPNEDLKNLNAACTKHFKFKSKFPPKLIEEI